MHIILLVCELCVLYILSRVVTQKLYVLFLQLFRIRSVAITFVLLLQFPGTVIHELAHLFTAEILRVQTGKLTLVPETIRGDAIKPGSVMIAETDPFRRYAIGLAPLFWGISVLTAISYLLPGLWANVTTSTLIWYEQPEFFGLLISGYLIFAISNSMFPSPPDVKGITPFIVTLLVFCLLGYVLGIRFQLRGVAYETVNAILETLTKSLGVVMAINVILLLFTTISSTLYSRAFGIRIYTGSAHHNDR